MLTFTIVVLFPVDYVLPLPLIVLSLFFSHFLVQVFVPKIMKVQYHVAVWHLILSWGLSITVGKKVYADTVVLNWILTLNG